MAADDIADSEALIFTEADVYMVAGHLAEEWNVEDDTVEDIERAITSTLANKLR